MPEQPPPAPPPGATPDPGPYHGVGRHTAQLLADYHRRMLAHAEAELTRHAPPQTPEG